MSSYHRPVSLCASCSYVKIVDSARGSRFLRCTRAGERMSDGQAYAKYPPQPVLGCEGYAASGGAAGEESLGGAT